MKRANFLVCFIIICLVTSQHLIAQKHIANGGRVVRRNRLVSVKSNTGKQLYKKLMAHNEKIQISIDGVTSEKCWQNAQVISSFSSAGKKDVTTVAALSDRENIYLYWDVHEANGITASVSTHDSILISDDYIQIDLRPWLPDSIKYGRDYFYSIAINPMGTVWDSYFDPYLGGYFFSSWKSNIVVKTTSSGNNWKAEMMIPFSGLDHSSDPGWKWQLEFYHSSKNAEHDLPVISYPPFGITVEQGVMVRRPSLVGYYWTRPEFMEEVKPERRENPAIPIQATNLNNLPLQNNRLDSSLWKWSKYHDIKFSDSQGMLLNNHTAKFKVGTFENYLCFNLFADGGQIATEDTSVERFSRGMKGQTAGLNGVFVDDALFANESFWIIIQPRRPHADRIHQNYYLILVNNYGKISGIRYDEFGRPDRKWRPTYKSDIYNTLHGWGAEICIEISSFDLPAKLQNTWGFNVFRNRIVEADAKTRSELQAYHYTGGDFLNPATFVGLANIQFHDNDVIRKSIERKISHLCAKILTYQSTETAITAQLQNILNHLSLKTKDDLLRAEEMCEYIDNQLGILDVEKVYASYPHLAKGGYALLDLQFIGRHGWAVGAMGTILRTEDGGVTWEAVDIKTDADLYAVFFINEKQGWVAGGRIRMGKTNEAMRHDERGGFGYIFYTNDGGKTWQCQHGERGRHIFDIHFVDEKTGFACGELGFLLYTENGGKQWRLSPTTGTKKWLYGLTFIDKMTGFIVGECETVLKTVDGGKTWTQINAPADRKFYGFRSFYRDVTFYGNTGCIVGQNGCVLVSNDRGQSWRPTATFFEPHLRELMDFTSVHFVSEKQGYAVGELGTNILATEDGGRSWSLRPVENTDWLRGVWADHTGKVVLVGEREKILISTDQGFSWQTAHGDDPKTDVLVMLAHGDDAAINLGAFYANYAIQQGKQIVDIEVLKDAHSVEYQGEIYNLEHHRDVRMSGVRTTTYFDEFENGNNGCDYYHFTQRLWQGEENVTRHMVAAIRAYRPDVIIIHGPVFGDYDKPGHKLSGRAGLPAFETSGGGVDYWPQLTRLGLKPWQAKKLYCLASESFPMTLNLVPISKIPLKGTDGTCWDWAEFVIRNFQSQGIYHAREGKLCLVESLVKVPKIETSVFYGLFEQN